MIIKSATFLESNTDHTKCPAPVHPEIAFIGRSNVGKSSLINMLTNHKNLAHTSGTPGKTQTINHYLINKEFYLADLPGYGYAKASKSSRRKWERMIRDYLMFRPNLLVTFMLADMRHSPQASDLEFMEWMGTSGIPFCIVFTKADKLKSSERQKNIDTYLDVLSESWEELPTYFITSSDAGSGKMELLDYISEVNQLFKRN